MGNIQFDGQCYVQHSVITIIGNFGSFSAAQTWVTIAQIPESYRPSSKISAPGIVNQVGSTSLYPARVIVGTDGNIQVAASYTGNAFLYVTFQYRLTQ